MGTRETTKEREIRLARFAKERGIVASKDSTVSTWFRDPQALAAERPREGNRVYDLDRFGGVTGAEEALSLRPKRTPVTHPQVEDSVRAIFMLLSARDAQVLRLYVEDQWTQRAVAAELRITQPTVNVAIKLALKHARQVAETLGITELWNKGKLVNLPTDTDESDPAPDTQALKAYRTYHGRLFGAAMTTVSVKLRDGRKRSVTCARTADAIPNSPLPDFSGGEAEHKAGLPDWFVQPPQAGRFTPEQPWQKAVSRGQVLIVTPYEEAQRWADYGAWYEVNRHVWGDNTARIVAKQLKYRGWTWSGYTPYQREEITHDHVACTATLFSEAWWAEYLELGVIRWDEKPCWYHSLDVDQFPTTVRRITMYEGHEGAAEHERETGSLYKDLLNGDPMYGVLNPPHKQPQDLIDRNARIARLQAEYREAAK